MRGFEGRWKHARHRILDSGQWLVSNNIEGDVRGNANERQRLHTGFYLLRELTMKRTLIVSILLLAALSMTGCSGVTTPAIAQSSGGSYWTSGSGASIKGIFTTISAEANLDASNGLASLDLPFQLPANVPLSKFQGTVSYRSTQSGCSPQALMSIQVDGVDAYRAITKTTSQMNASDGGCRSNWEIQGSLVQQ
jgi:hypothetical protein